MLKNFYHLNLFKSEWSTTWNTIPPRDSNLYDGEDSDDWLKCTSFEENVWKIYF